jgi:hypothetical protein
METQITSIDWQAGDVACIKVKLAILAVLLLDWTPCRLKYYIAIEAGFL